MVSERASRQVTYLGWAWKQGQRSPSTRPSAVPQQRDWSLETGQTGSGSMAGDASKSHVGDIENQWIWGVCVDCALFKMIKVVVALLYITFEPYPNSLCIFEQSWMCTYESNGMTMLLCPNGPLQILSKPQKVSQMMTLLCGGFHKWGYPKWMVYKGKSH